MEIKGVGWRIEGKKKGERPTPDIIDEHVNA